MFNPNTNSFVDYIVREPVISDGYLKIFDDNYMGSTTRIGEIGTFYIAETNTWIPLKFRIVNSSYQVIYEYQLTQSDMEQLKKTQGLGGCYTDRLFIKARSLHRFKGYPFEISGVAIKL